MSTDTEAARDRGTVQNVHKTAECLDTREIQHATAFLACFPSLSA